MHQGSQKNPVASKCPTGTGEPEKVRDACSALSSTLPRFQKAFGIRSKSSDTHLIASAPWGGTPNRCHLPHITPSKNDGTTIYQLSVKDVPVNGFCR